MISLQLWISVGSKNQPSSKVLLWISLDMGRHRYRPTQLWQLWMLAGQREYQQNNCCEMSSNLLLTFCKLIPSTKSIRIWYYMIPIGSMYGIFTYIYHKHQPNVGKYTIHDSYMILILILYIRVWTNLTKPAASASKSIQITSLTDGLKL